MAMRFLANFRPKEIGLEVHLLAKCHGWESKNSKLLINGQMEN